MRFRLFSLVHFTSGMEKMEARFVFVQLFLPILLFGALNISKKIVPVREFVPIRGVPMKGVPVRERRL